MNQLINRMSAAIGEDFVSQADLAAFAVSGRTPLFVASPATPDELAACVAYAYEAGVPLVPQGGGTRMRWGGHLAAEQFVVLNLARLKRVVEYEPDDLTISVEAGMPLAELSALLASNNQMLPLDAALPRRSTIGGILATAADGPRRLLYGSARDLLIGIRVVEATGRISKAGGMVVKNVSGFDMMKLYLGSFGSLAIIASANFKLIPRPRAAAALVVSCQQFGQAMALAEEFGAAQLAPAAVEFVAGHTLPGCPPSTCALVVLAEGLPAAVERIVREVQQRAQQQDASVTVLRETAHQTLHAALCDLSATADLPASALALRLSSLPANLLPTLISLQRYAMASGLGLQISARALNGLAYLNAFHADPAVLSAFYRVVLASEASPTLLSAPAELAASLPAWGEQIANRALMQRIKDEFDPQHRLNPGRFVVS